MARKKINLSLFALNVTQKADT